MYLNYKKKHEIKFQNTVLLNKLIMMQKLYKEKLNDEKMFKLSKMKNRMKKIFRNQNNIQCFKFMKKYVNIKR